MANAIYNSFKGKIMDGSIDLDTDTIKVVLVTSDYSPDIDTHTQYSHITNQVANGNGYTTGGAALEDKDVSVDTENDKGVFDATDVTWAASTITAKGAILYKFVDDGGNPAATSPLICYFDFTEDKVSSNGNFTIQWHANGILNLS
jgi:hypothetical protein